MFRVVTVFALTVVALASEGKILRLYKFIGSLMFTFSSLSAFEQDNLQKQGISNLCFCRIFALPKCRNATMPLAFVC